MVIEDDNSLDFLSQKGANIVEISSFPDTGATSACLYLCSKYLKLHTEELSTIFFSGKNAPNAEYLSTLFFREEVARATTVLYDTNEAKLSLDYLDEIAKYSSLIIIDDFYNFILHKNYTFIRDFMKKLLKISVENATIIVLVNQNRYIVDSREYKFGSTEATKTLYWEHLEAFVKIRLEVYKDDNRDIHIAMKSIKEKPREDDFASFLGSMGRLEA